MRAEAISGSDVMRVLYTLEPFGNYRPDYGEISEAIASAANQDPILPERPDGCALTAMILTAIAWHASHFNRSLVSQGRRFGMYQIELPEKDANGQALASNMVTNPRTASLVMIDLLRRRILRWAQRPGKRPWIECLAETDHQVDIMQSMQRMLTANRMLGQHFPKHAAIPLLASHP